MNKLSNFNQVVYAIIGVFVLVVLLVLGVNFVLDLFPSDQPNQDRLIIGEEADSLSQNNLRKQVISLEMLQEFDTNNHIYLIPVRHKTLSEPQSKKGLLLELGSYDFEDYYSYGDWNNLIIYDARNAEKKIILNHRVNINQYRVIRSAGELYIVFTGWSKDSNKDGELGYGDFVDFYIYSYEGDVLTRVENDQYLIKEFRFYSDIEKLIVSVTKTPETPETSIEELPDFLLHYSFESKDFSLIVDSEMMDEIQAIIDN